MQTEISVNNPVNYGQTFGTGIPANRDDVYDANRRRLAFVCGYNQIEIDQLESGLKEKFLSPGTLIKFVAARISVPTFEIVDADKPASELRTFSAKIFLDASVSKVGRRENEFGQKDSDYGLRALSMLVGLPYEEDFADNQHRIFNDEADVYFQIVYPRQTARGRVFLCPEGLADCPTCSLAWLNSPDCNARISDAIARGKDPLILQKLAAVLRDSVTQTLRHANRMWNEIVRDTENAKNGKYGKSVLDDNDHHIRKMLHQIAPDLRQSSAIVEASKQTGEQIASGIGNAMENVLERVMNHRNERTSAPDAAIEQETQNLRDANAKMYAMLEKVGGSLDGFDERFKAIEERLAAYESQKPDESADAAARLPVLKKGEKEKK